MGLYGCENLNSARSVKMVNLRKWGYLKEGMTFHNLTFSWSRDNEVSATISADVTINESGTGSMRLYYTSTTRWNGESKHMDFVVPLGSTPCRFGGRKWFFRCPNQHCQRRCRILYSYNEFHVCRRCTGLWYDSQTYTLDRYRALDNLFRADRLAAQIKRRFYRGKPTRRYKRFLKLTGGLDGMELVHFENALTNELLTPKS